MALLKAFVCQVLLLGLYKVFLEKVVEEHLVPDELTRNCLVGFVCLLCFGIQLYTDKAGDDDDDETEGDLKVKSKSRGSTGAQKFELTENYFTEDAVTKIIGSKESCHSLNTETTSQKIATGKKQSSEDQQKVNSKDGIRVETKKVTGLFPNVGTFSESSTNIPSTTNEAASTYHDSFEQNTRSIPVVNGTSKENICEDSEEESIEIDQFVPKESSEEALLHKLEATKLEQVTRAALESECLTSNGMPTLSSQDSGSSISGSESDSNIISGIEIDQFVPKESAEEAEKSISHHVEATKVEQATRAALESECLSSNGIPTLSTQDSGSSINESKSELNIINGKVGESSNVTNEMSSNSIKEIESKKLTEGNEVGDKVDTSSKDASESNEHAKENISCFQERYCARSTSTKVELNTPNKSNPETSTLPPSRRRKLSQNVVITSVNIDISFLYAFY